MYLSYLKYVLRHKYFVFLSCCHYRLFWRGIIHDWSKFLPDEFSPYAKHFYGGINKGKDGKGYYKAEDTNVDPAFDLAWLKHQRRNKHHYQWWVLSTDEEGIKVLEMPLQYRQEMVADWRGAGRAQGTPDTARWYQAHKGDILLGDDTRKWVEHELGLN